MHKNWCGKPCAECDNPCALDESMPCSPDCEALGENGECTSEECKTCDAICNKIYTHDKAAQIIELFEDVLSRYDIEVPSPEDYEREPDNMVGLYGSTYSDLLDDVEAFIVELLEDAGATVPIIQDEFSGTI